MDIDVPLRTFAHALADGLDTIKFFTMEEVLECKDQDRDTTIGFTTPKSTLRKQLSHPALSTSVSAREVLRSKSTASRGRLRISPVPLVPAEYSSRSPTTPIYSETSPSTYHTPQSKSIWTPPTNHKYHDHVRIAQVNRVRAKDMQKYVEKKFHGINQDGPCSPHSPNAVNMPESPPRSSSTRPRQASVTRLHHVEKPKPLTHSPTFPMLPEQPYGDLQMPMAFPALTRNRGASTSQTLCRNGDTTMLSRPSTARPDYGFHKTLIARQRDPLTFRSRHPDSHNRECHIVGTGSASPVSDSSTEVRASFRSVMTSSSSLLDASSTERSSVVTKSSSISDGTNDLSCQPGAKDQDFSVDDAISMYAAGFSDDEGLESGNEETATLDNDERAGPRRETGGALEDNRGERQCGLPPPHNSRKNPGLEIPGGGFADDGPPDLPTIMAATETRDRYGFRKATQHVTLRQYDAWNEGYTECLKRRKPKWQAMMREHGLTTDEPTRFPPKSAKMKRFVRKGIPPEWRGAAWFWYAGGFPLLQKHPGRYQKYLDQSNRGDVSENDAELIERDLHRTFPDNIRFKPEHDPVAARSEGSNNTHSGQPHTHETPLLRSLRRVLHAFSLHNPRIGYCQSLNFLAGLLLLFMPEEKAFWMLVIITTVYLPGTHEVSLEGANVDLWVLMTSIQESMPTIWTRIAGDLDGSSVTAVNRLPPITLCTTAWFMSCFIGTLPVESVLRVWDTFFYEGSRTLFRVALAVFKIGEGEIKAVTDPMEIFQVVQTIPRRLVDAGMLMDVCFRRRNGFGHLKQETVEERRRERRKMYADERIRAFTSGGADQETGNDGARREGSFRKAFRRVRTDSNLRPRKMLVKK